MSTATATSVSPPPASINRPSGSKRVVSLDQYRGYAVAGMLVVNFLGHHDVTHQFLKHNNTHFSWGDSIMPAFIFVCGISFRLSIVKRSAGGLGSAMKFVRRSMALVLVSMLMYGVGSKIDKWADMTPAGVFNFLANILKADLWEVLAIIGVCQLIVLPVMRASSRVRLMTAIAFCAGHVVLSAWFNYSFVAGMDNGLDRVLGLTGRTAWDGGFFGLFSWAIPMLAGTLVFDLMQSGNNAKIVRALLGWGTVLMVVGYLASCLTTLYDVRDTNTVEVSYPAAPENAVADRVAAEKAAAEKAKADKTGETEEEKAAREQKEREWAQWQQEQNLHKTLEERRAQHAASPVIPPFANVQNRPWTSLLAEPPFVPPPPVEKRKLNYWMMTKRISTQSFMLFATGFTCAVYALFVLACDIGSFHSRLFAMFGENALVAYIIHHAVGYVVSPIVPDDSPAWWATCGLAIFFAITCMIVRYLNRNNLYLRL